MRANLAREPNCASKPVPGRVRGWRHFTNQWLCLWLLMTTSTMSPPTALAASAADSMPISTDDAIARTAGWPLLGFGRRPAIDSSRYPTTPHPAVARIIAPEKGATAYGSGTLVDVRDQYGLVVTNWHVVSDANGPVEVVFPEGFRSQARPLKVDRDWDLAALVIWRPPIEPVKLAPQPPRPGDVLTIHGYGKGQYRVAPGRCTQYYAPHANFPAEMVELDVEARQGDSGGPIFNQRGELAGVLFGAGKGTTLGSFGPRVCSFLATLAPDIGQPRNDVQLPIADRAAPNVCLQTPKTNAELFSSRDNWPSSPWTPATRSSNAAGGTREGFKTVASGASESWSPAGRSRYNWYEPAKSCLAVIGLAAIALRLVKFVR